MKGHPTEIITSGRQTNLSYLEEITERDKHVMAEMITVYLEQTPRFIKMMEEGSAGEMDWEKIQKAVHSLIPSFTVVGIDERFEKMARQIQENALRKEDPEQTKELIREVADVCLKACEELKVELLALTIE